MSLIAMPNTALEPTAAAPCIMISGLFIDFCYSRRGSALGR
jgi:hypothetical protein